MTKGKRKRKRPGGGGPAGPSPEAILAELGARAEEIAAADPGEAGPLWGAAHKLLLKTDVDASEAARIVATRDAGGLSHVVRVLAGDETAEEETAPADETPTTPAADVPAETLKKAMRAFRKRLKLTRLDHESKLGVGPMSGGRRADFDAIMAPREFPPEVWEALVAQGKLRPMGPGFYELAEEAGHGE
jgi:hypothetical protein